MPMLAEELLAAIPCCGATFIWADAEGGFANSYDPHPEAERVAATYLEKFYGPREFGLGFRELMRRGWGVQSMEENFGRRLDEFLASDQYNLIHRPLGHGPYIFLVVRTPVGPFGLGYLMLSRGLRERPFSAEDRVRLARLEPFLGHLLTADASPAFPLAGGTATGVIVATVDGRVVHASREARRLLHLASSRDTLRAGDGMTSGLPPIVARLCRNLTATLNGDEAAGAPTLHHRNVWGGFTFTAHRLDSSDDAAGLVGMVVTFREPRAIALLRGIRKLPLSRRQSEVCRLMAEGLAHSEIARRLGISRHTVIAHARWIYDKLDVHDRSELVARLVASNGEAPAIH